MGIMGICAKVSVGDRLILTGPCGDGDGLPLCAALRLCCAMVCTGFAGAMVDTAQPCTHMLNQTRFI